MTMVADAVNGRNPLLLPQREAPYCLRGVFELVLDGCRNEVVLDLGECYFVIRVNQDIDALDVQFLDTKFTPNSKYCSINSITPWNSFVGKEYGWSWIAINQQGYNDSIMLSFASIIPSILLHVIASSIRIFSLIPVNEGPTLATN